MAMEDIFQDKVDLKARQRSLKAIKKSFHKIIEQVNKGIEPKLVIRKRTLANTIYDPERKLLLLGKEKLVRKFLDEGEARRFMQTILMASIIYEALANNEYPTIRDLFYRGKHTLPLATPRDKYKNTWEEQKESDAVLRDVEVITGKLREEMLILSKEKGKVVGNMKIRSGSDTIDLSKMGHGAYAIESTPDLIEFKDVDAEYVLIVEKDAVFQQLHRIGYWKKTRSILITSAGQPDRATRRFVRRLNEELKLPVYVLTDSIPEDEVVIARDPITGKLFIQPIKEIVERFFSDKEKERIFIPLEVPAWDASTGKIRWNKVGYVYRHRISEPILKIKTKGRGTIKVTKAHSLFVFRDGRIKVIPAQDIKPGDYIIVAQQLSSFKHDSDEKQIEINIIKSVIKHFMQEKSRFNPLRTIKIRIGNKQLKLAEAKEKDIEKATEILLSRSKWIIPNKIILDRDLAWLLGIYLAEGSWSKNRYVVFNLSIKESEKAEHIRRIIKRKFGVDPIIVYNKNKNETRIIVGSKIVFMLFKELGLIGRAREKRVPNIILNAPSHIQAFFIKGLIDGDGHIDKYDDIIYSTRSPVLAKQLFNILLSLGTTPTVVENGEDIIIRISKNKYRTRPEVYSVLTGKESSGRGNNKELPTEPTYGLPISQGLNKLLVRNMNQGFISYSITSRTISKPKLEKLQTITGSSLIQDYEKILKGDVVVVKVVDVEYEEYEGYVYDFTVPENNSFLGSYGVVYHNSDPYGFYIYSVFKIGSITLSYESERLATPSARFLGVMMSDVFGDDVPLSEIYVSPKEIGGGKNIQLLRKEKKQRFLKALKKFNYKEKLDKKPFLSESERKNYIIKAKEQDLARAVELVGDKVYREFTSETLKITKGSKRSVKRSPGYPWFQDPRWIKEIGIFFLTRSKLEIEAVSSKGLRFLAFEYLPTKIETGDWLD